MEEPSFETIIPYFYFDNRSDKKLLRLSVHIDPLKFTDVKFELRNNEVLILSESYKTQKYFVKIRLPIEVIHSEETTCHRAEYNEDSQYYEWHFEKNVPRGTKIPDLDLLSCHIAWHDDTIREPSWCSRRTSLTGNKFCIHLNLWWKPIEILEPDPLSECSTSGIAKDVIESMEALKLKDTEKSRVGFYGFGCRYTKNMSSFETYTVELPDPERSDPEDRRLMRWEAERQSFDVDHYFADFFFQRGDEDDADGYAAFKIATSCHPDWYKLKYRPVDHRFTSNEMAVLAELPCKEYNLSGKERLEVLHSLLDIILAYAYDYRITDQKHNCESAWNISKLSATLSWFQVHRHAGDAVDSFLRRSLTYPLCRSWILSMVVYRDALDIFHRGRRQILNCLMKVHTIFDADEDRKFLNELYIKDYLIWIQQVHPQTIRNYVTHISSCGKIRKEDVFAVLPLIEEKAMGMIKEDEDKYFSWYRRYLWFSRLIDKRPVNRNVHSKLSSEDSSSDSEDTSSDSEDTSSDFEKSSLESEDSSMESEESLLD